MDPQNAVCLLAPCDVLLHAGDVSSVGTPQQIKDFNHFLGTTQSAQRVVIAGARRSCPSSFFFFFVLTL
jgi:hypothetical protein